MELKVSLTRLHYFRAKHLSRMSIVKHTRKMVHTLQLRGRNPNPDQEMLKTRHWIRIQAQNHNTSKSFMIPLLTGSKSWYGIIKKLKIFLSGSGSRARIITPLIKKQNTVMHLPEELSCWCAARSLREWTSKSAGWKSSWTAVGRSLGSFLRHCGRKLASFMISLFTESKSWYRIIKKLKILLRIRIQGKNNT